MSTKLINWDQSYSVGIDIIDKQHKKLVDIINVLFNSFSDGKAERIVTDVINKLVEYTEYHFKIEEDLFEEYDYPEKEEHILKHNQFVDQIIEWKNKLSTGDKNIHYDLLNYLKTWLLEHIKGEDTLYSQYFKENNIII